MAVTDIKHVFVLMLENRSYDHLLGALSLSGVGIDGAPTVADGIAAGAFTNSDASGNSYANSYGGDPTAGLPADPPHEYDDVVRQLLGDNQDPPYNYSVSPINLSGFVRSYAAEAGAAPLGAVLQSLPDGAVPNLATLGRQYCVCDRWFSSLPGPTVPNRFFLTAATSGGNPKSPSGFRLGSADLFDSFKFINGNIFKRIKERTSLSHRIYRGDSLPFSSLLESVDYDQDTVAFTAAGFAADCNRPNLPNFVLIEPNYDIFDGFRNGNSMHPLGNVQRGDQLIKEVYDGISQSACWGQSLFIITFDEHGGFFDHVIPPKATAPGDVPDVYDFHFTQLGVRVPAVVVSPLLAQSNLIDHTVYDHTSMLATLAEVFPELGALGSFTMRDRLANSLSHLFAGPAAAARPPVALVEHARPAAALAPPPAVDHGPLGHAEVAGLRIAAALHYRLLKGKRHDISARLNAIANKGEARAYVQQVEAHLKLRPGQ
ncbi:MAG TPA: alkaline phosphatase family protein [Opitutaceae bacterium]